MAQDPGSLLFFFSMSEQGKEGPGQAVGGVSARQKSPCEGDKKTARDSKSGQGLGEGVGSVL